MIGHGGLVGPVAVDLIQQQHRRNVARLRFLAEAIEDLECRAAVVAGGEQNQIRRLAVVEEPRQHAVRIGRNQHAVAVPLELLAERVLHLHVGLDDHQLARLAGGVVAFAAFEFGAGDFAAFGGGLHALDRQLQVDQHVGRRLVALVRDRIPSPCSTTIASGSGSLGTSVRIGLMSCCSEPCPLGPIARFGERRLAAEHLVENAAAEEDVGAWIVLADAAGAVPGRRSRPCGG